MSKVSQMALAACLAISAFRTLDAFTASTHYRPARASAASRRRGVVPVIGSTPKTHHRPSSSSSSSLTMSSSTAADEKKSSSLKRLPDSAVELTLHVPSVATTAAYDRTLADVAKKVSIPGFRKGAKIPPAVIENAWARQGGKRVLRTMAINSICDELIGKTLKEEYDLEPIGSPTLVTPAEHLAESFVPGEELDVIVKCDVWPEIRWKDVEGRDKPYMGLRGKYKRGPFNQARFDAAIRDLTERYAKLEPYEDESRPLAMGDACTVNMVGYMANADGSKGMPLPDAASGDNVEVILGGGRYMAGLVEGLEGGRVGETKTVNVRFPDALKNKDLAGKNAIFDVTILSASKRVLPDITDEFADQVRPGLTAEGLRAELLKAVDAQDAQEYMGARNAALGNALSDCMDVDIPDTLVTNQAREKYALMMTDMRDSGMADEEIKKLISPENFVKYKDIAKADIVRDFKISMAVDEIARLENIQVPAYQVEEQIQSLKDQATKEGTAASDMDDEQIRRKVESTLERRMVYDLLADAAILEVEYTNEEEFDEALMEKLAAESVERELAAEGKQSEVVVATTSAEGAGKKDLKVDAEAAVQSTVMTKEDDLELTTQVIMKFINSESDEDGVVDDDDDDEV